MKSQKVKIKLVVLISVLGITACTASSNNPSANSPTPLVTDSTASPALIRECNLESVSYTWGQSQGAAGTLYRMLLITNSSASACGINQAPAISLFANQAKNLITTVDSQAGIDLGFPVILGAGKTLELPIGTPNPDNFDEPECLKMTANWLVIKLNQDNQSLDLKVESWPVCSISGAGPFFQSVTLN